MRENSCQASDCTGTYKYQILYYVNRFDIRNGVNKQISEKEYLQLLDKKGFHAVTDNICDVCGDSLDKRLSTFIRDNFKP